MILRQHTREHNKDNTCDGADDDPLAVQTQASRAEGPGFYSEACSEESKIKSAKNKHG